MPITKAFYRGIAFLLTSSLLSCNYNPLISDNHLTGSPTVGLAGGVAGAGIAGWLGASKPLMAIAGVGGAGLAYYLTTLRFSAGPLIAIGGQVYTIGDYVGIVIPTDNLFDSNTHDFLPGTEPVLASIAAIAARFPDSNIMVSGNMSGFASSSFENTLSESRAREIASYLWSHGVNSFQEQSNDERKLVYIGYGNYFPVANNIRLKGIRENSRIQITIYPPNCQLKLDQRFKVFNNVGGLNHTCATKINVAQAFKADHMPEGSEISKPTDWRSDLGLDESTQTQNDERVKPMQDYHPDVKGEMSDSMRGNYNHIESSTTISPPATDYKHEGLSGRTDWKGEK